MSSNETVSGYEFQFWQVNESWVTHSTFQQMDQYYVALSECYVLLRKVMEVQKYEV
jgi:hypothetical protein